MAFYFCADNNEQKNETYEIKNETHRCPPDMGSDLSIDHTLPLFLRSTPVLIATLSTHFPAHHYPGALDAVCRIALRGFGCKKNNSPEQEGGVKY